MRSVHYNCFAGISGDMNLGAWVDAGVDPAALEAELRKLNLDGWTLKVGPDSRQGISGTRVEVICEGDGHSHAHHHDQSHEHSHDHHHAHHDYDHAHSHDDHDHTHEPAGSHSHGDAAKHTHAHNHGHSHDHSHDHAHGHSHSHGHDHGHGHHHHHGDGHHHHRTYADIRQLIQASALSDAIKDRSIAIFQRIAEAEAQVHSKTIDDVHFHEVGAVDSIVDIVGAAVCLDLMKIDRVTASSVELGGGTVMCAHGRMPVPAPATALLIKGMPVSHGAVQKECTTPTGAAILAATVDQFIAPGVGIVTSTGTGIGGRDTPELANVLQIGVLDGAADAALSAADAAVAQPTETIVELAANLDDMTGEELGHLIEALLEAGAKDAWAVPVTMKKSRPGVMLMAMALPEQTDGVRAAMLMHSTTLGVRERRLQRTILPRRSETASTRFGDITMRVATLPDGAERAKPEFDDCAAAARAFKVSVREVSRAAEAAWSAASSDAKASPS